MTSGITLRPHLINWDYGQSNSPAAAMLLIPRISHQVSRVRGHAAPRTAGMLSCNSESELTLAQM